MKTIIKTEKLQELTKDIFMQNGVPEEHAVLVADGLVKANLRGVDSHGVARIPMYLHRIREGVVNLNPKINKQSITPSVSLLDADNGLGFIAGKAAMQEAIELAKTMGIGLVGVKNSGHYGMAANYVLQALEAGMISFVYTNASPAMPVWGGRTKLLGSSPFAAGAPGGQKEDYLLDMACTVTARGKLKYAAQRGEAIPEGLALDAEGKPTTDGEAAFHGVVLPFGGAKGAALSMLMDILCGVLTGAAFGGDVKNPYMDTSGPQNVGHFFVALRPNLFMPQEDYESRMDTLVDRAKNSPTAEGFDEVMMTGEPETRTEQERSKSGIPLTADVVESIEEEANKVSLKWSDYL